jgi:hypothetical protein
MFGMKQSATIRIDLLPDGAKAAVYLSAKERRPVKIQVN